jgi:hypothetical protein
LNLYYIGALICAEIELRSVRRVIKSELHEVQDSNAWWEDYDTIYYAHEQENLDEFCVKDPAQILRWVIVMDDDRLYRYGLDREFDKTRCGCI